MSINYNLDINNDFELSSNYPKEFKEEQTNTYKSVENQFLCDSFNYLEPEKDLEQIYFYPPKPKPKKVFHIEKDKNKDKKFVQDLTLEHKNIFETIKINKVNPPLNQISNNSKEETKENTNKKDAKIILGETNHIGRKRKNPETEKTKDKRERTDNCRLKIARNFFNNFVLKLNMNQLIKKNGSNLYFEKFPQKLILKATYKKNKSYLNETLEDFLTKKELSEVDDTDEHFAHNLDMLKKLKDNDDNKNVLEKSGFDDILGKSYRDLYQEYLNSDIYNKKIEEIEKLDESNAKQFKRVSKNLIEFLENKI